MKKVFRRNQIIITTLAVMIAIAGYLNFAGGEMNNQEATTVSDNAVQEGASDLLDLSEEDIEAQNVADANLEEILVANEEEGDELPVIDETASAAPDGSATAAPSTAPLTSEEAQKASEILEENTSPGEAVLTTTGVVATARLNREQVRSKNQELLQQIIDNSALTSEQKEEAVSSMVQLTQNAELEAATESLLAAKGFTDVLVSITDTSVDVVVNEADLTDAKRAQIEDIVKRKTGNEGSNIVIMPVQEEQ